MSEALLHFHLGPAQAFIGGARRARDIWAGSFLLSWLSASALQAALSSMNGSTDSVDTPYGVGKDPTFLAVQAKFRSTAGAGEPFLGTFPNQFVLKVDSSKAAVVAAAAAAAVRSSWTQLGQAVAGLIFDTEVDGKMLGERYPEARDRFDSQISVNGRTPMWEILTVVDIGEAGRVKLPGVSPISPMALRKLNRWSDDAAALPAQQEGSPCTMLAGWTEISAARDPSLGETKRLQREFWAYVRAAVVAARYHEHPDRSRDWECLDIRPNEQLSAPALVKRLFPILPRDVLVKTIGWMPLVPAPYVSEDRADDGPADPQDSLDAFRQFIGRTIGLVRGASVAPAPPLPPAPLMSPEPTNAVSGKAKPDARTQHLMLWPSTSYVAAAHWLERVQRQPNAAEAADTFAASVAKAGRHLRYAERSLFIKCTSDHNRHGIVDVDGACFFETSVQRLIKEAKEYGGRSLALQEVARHLEALKSVPLSPDAPNGPRIGAPAPIYAIVRADGDEMGKLLVQQSREKPVSKGLGKFIKLLRGEHDKLGTIVEANGITLYAAADEMIALCPLEDALDLAIQVRDDFNTAMGTDSKQGSGKKGKTPQQPTSGPTASVAITFAHRQVPLSWVLESGSHLLKDVAKKTTGRNALAIEILDVGGRTLQWAANWDSPDNPIAKLRTLLAFAVGAAPTLGSNQFMHRYAETLAPLLLDEDGLEFKAWLTRMQGSSASGLESLLAPPSIAEPLVRRLVVNACETAVLEPGDIDVIVDALISISRGYWKEKKSGSQQTSGLMSGTGVRLLRFLSENWRGDPPRLERDTVLKS